MPKGHVKISITIPVQMREDLEYIASKMGVSKSALLTSLSAEPLSDLAKLISSVPENPTQEQVLRLRGASVDLIEQRMDSLRKLDNDLFGNS